MDRNASYRESWWKRSASEHLLKRQLRNQRREGFGQPVEAYLSMDDILDLGMRVPLCFDPFETSLQVMQEVSHKVLDEVVLPMSTKVERVADLSQETRELLEPLLAGEVAGWALALFGLGLESGLENYSLGDGYRLMEILSRVYGLSATHPLRVLGGRGALKDFEEAAYRNEMIDRIMFWGSSTWAWGIEMCFQLRRTSDEFLKALEETARQARV